jgi:hypothetical protein
MTTSLEKTYFTDRQESYLKSLSPLFSAASKVLKGHLPERSIPVVISNTRATFPQFLAELPYLGGDWNLFNSSIIAGVAALAYIHALEKEKVETAVIDKSIHDLYALAYSSLPGIIKAILRGSEFSARHMRQLREFEVNTQKREFPENYVIRFVPGDDSTFDFGFDCEECALLKFYERMGAEQHLTYLCIGDYAASRALRTGLRRTTTLAYGGKCCDFRYKRNSLGLEGYPPEKLPEYRAR